MKFYLRLKLLLLQLLLQLPSIFCSIPLGRVYEIFGLDTWKILTFSCPREGHAEEMGAKLGRFLPAKRKVCGQRYTSMAEQQQQQQQLLIKHDLSRWRRRLQCNKGGDKNSSSLYKFFFNYVPEHNGRGGGGRRQL